MSPSTTDPRDVPFAVRNGTLAVSGTMDFYESIPDVTTITITLGPLNIEDEWIPIDIFEQVNELLSEAIELALMTEVPI